MLIILQTAFLRSDKFISIPVLITVVIILLFFVTYLVFYNLLPPKIPLFYSLPWGEEELANKQQLLILPAILALAALINSTLAWNLHSSQLTLKRILTSSLLLLDLVIMTTIIKIALIFI